MAWTKVFFATDLHGSDLCYRKFLNSAKAYGAPYLVCGGDITGKMIVPIVAEGQSLWRTSYLGSEIRLDSEAELENLVKGIKGSGFYPLVLGRDEYEAMTEDRATALFDQMMQERLREWNALAEERLPAAKVKGFIMPGNDDPPPVDEILGGPWLENSEGRVVRVGDFEMVSIGSSNPTPWNCHRDVPEEELARRIEAVLRDVQDMKNCIFNFHCPPHDSQLDLAPELDSELRPKLQSGGEMRMVPVGSTAVRAAIEEHQPMLALVGHIHESRGAVKIGRTVCINPGSEYQAGALRGVLLSISHKGQVNWALTSG